MTDLKLVVGLRVGHPWVFNELLLTICCFLKGHEELAEKEGNMKFLVLDHLKLKFISSIKCHFSSAYSSDKKVVEI